MAIISKTAAQWEAAKTTVLAAGDTGYETDTYKRKIGDGVTQYQNLKYETLFRPRRATKAQWTTKNPVIGKDEFVIESDTKRYKIGDGASTYTALAYGDAAHNHDTKYAPLSHTHTDKMATPSNSGTTGQVLTKTDAGHEWQTPSSSPSTGGSGLTTAQATLLGSASDLQTTAKTLPGAVNELKAENDRLGQEMVKNNGMKLLYNYTHDIPLPDRIKTTSYDNTTGIFTFEQELPTWAVPASGYTRFPVHINYDCWTDIDVSVEVGVTKVPLIPSRNPVWAEINNNTLTIWDSRADGNLVKFGTNIDVTKFSFVNSLSSVSFVNPFLGYKNVVIEVSGAGGGTLYPTYYDSDCFIFDGIAIKGKYSSGNIKSYYYFTRIIRGRATLSLSIVDGKVYIDSHTSDIVYFTGSTVASQRDSGNYKRFAMCADSGNFKIGPVNWLGSCILVQNTNIKIYAL